VPETARAHDDHQFPVSGPIAPYSTLPLRP
jgi:hypothetical protein